jgi:hypothetical protein
MNSFWGPEGTDKVPLASKADGRGTGREREWMKCLQGGGEV